MPKYNEAMEDAGAALAVVEDTDTDVATSADRRTVYSTSPDFDDEDLMRPLLRLAQGMTPEVKNREAVEGQFILPGYDPLDEVTLIPLMVGKNRRFQEKDADRPRCTSNDAVQGHGDPGIACGSCPFATEWTKGDGDKNIPPPCVMSYSYVMYSVEHDQLVTFNIAAKTKVNRTAAQFINQVYDNARKRRRRGLGNGLTAVKVKADKASSGRNSWAVPSPVLAKNVPEEAMEAALEAFQSLAGE